MPAAGSYDGKVVLVTGSSSGIGEAVAHAFDDLGATVVVNSSTSVAAGEAVAASLRTGSYVQGTVSGDEAAAAALIDSVLEAHGRLDVLINNAGTTAVIPHHDLEAASVDEWRRIFEVNVFGTWAITVAAAGALRAAKGSVINMGSIAGLRARSCWPRPSAQTSGSTPWRRASWTRRGPQIGTSCARWSIRWPRSSGRQRQRTWLRWSSISPARPTSPVRSWRSMVG